MKGFVSRFALLIILCSLFTPVISFTPISEVKGADQIFFQDNFENYTVGTFPSSGGWELWYNGAGTEQQVIVDNVSVSPTKSLKLLGVDFWAGFAAKRFTSSSHVIGFEVAVRVEETNEQSRDNARVSFTTKLSSSISRECAPVTFQDSGVITSGGQVLQSYVADTWYKIKLIMDRTSETYSVWVDGELKGENLQVTTTSPDTVAHPSYEIDAFSVSQCYNSVTAYFDDVKVFSVFDADPKLELVPNKGIAATTLVGSGFAPNSRISVTWDGTTIPTVPSPLITDGNGNFTGIISVLNQTDGTYTVRTVDELGNTATATFTVNIGVLPQTPEATPSVRFITYRPVTIEERADPITGEMTQVAHLVVDFALFKVNEWADYWEFKAWLIRNNQILFLANWTYGFSAADPPRCQLSGSGDGFGFIGMRTVTDEFPYKSEILTHPDDGTQKYYFYRTHLYFKEDTFAEGDQIIIKAEFEKMPTYEGKELKVDSNPSGVSFTVDNVEYAAPWSAIYVENAQVTLTMPEYYVNKGENYTWSQWRDGNTDRTRTVTMNQNVMLTATFTPENTSTVISILSPQNTTYNATEVPLEYTVNRAVYWAAYSLDGEKNVSITGNTTLTGLSEGMHSIVVYIEDASGTITASETVYFTVNTTVSDTTAPTISIISPTNTTYSSGDIPLTFTVDEQTETMGYTIDGQANVTITGNTTLTGISDGTHFVLVYANDTVGNPGYAITYFTVASAVSGISVLSPENTTYTEADVPLTYTKNETCYVSYFGLDGQLNSTEPGNTTLTGLADGAHHLVICANYTESPVGEIVVVDFTVNVAVPDTTQPDVFVLSPANTTYSSTDVALAFNVTEPTDLMWYTIDEQAKVTVTGNTTLTELHEGPHSLIVYANDTSGNTGSSDTIYFTVALEPTIFSVQSPENRTYNTADIPLAYTKNETCNNVTYILDEQPPADTENVTVLLGLPDGVHELTIVANYTDSPIGETATVKFTVDTTPPNITDVYHVPINVNGTLEDGAQVNATVVDALSEVNWVALNYTDDNGTWVIAEMTNLEGDVWNGTVPAFPHDTNVTYIIIAEDKAGNTVTTEELYGQPNQYQVLPEFPLWIILPLFLVATASTMVVRKRLSLPALTKISNKLHKLLT